MIGHQLYGKNNEEAFRERINQIALLKRLRQEPAEFWSNLLKKYFDQPSVTIIGVPNEKMVEQIAEEEKKRLNEQKKRLGKEGIKQSGENIEAAIKENTVCDCAKEESCF